MLYEYDARQDKCPLPLVKTRVLLKKMQEGDSCSVKICDQGSIRDIPNLLIKQGYRFSQKKIDCNTVELLISI